MLTQVLEEEGYAPICAANGLEALRKLRLSPTRPSLILLDLMMPVMNGWEFRAEQEHDPSLASIPVVVLSADRQLTSIDAAHHVKKPIELKTLFDVVARFAA